MMRKLATATAVAASAILAAPAAARDGTYYAGIEGGLMIVQDSDFDYSDAGGDESDAIVVDHDRGFDVGIIGGYDFGAFRLEAEAAYKRANVEQIYFDPAADIVPVGNMGTNDANGRVQVTSGMANALLDFGDEGVSGFAGLGLGLARVQYRAVADMGGSGFGASDNALAWQALAGVRFPVGTNLEAGVKYRFFNTRNLKFDIGGAVPAELSTRFRSHSLLASLVYNFAAPAAPVVVEAPVAAPPPPATQTCPDGSVILATDACPVPPPPPPAPSGERG